MEEPADLTELFLQFEQMDGRVEALLIERMRNQR